MRTANMMFVMAVAIALVPISRARADTLLFQATLQGSKEKVPNSVHATGHATVKLDTAAKTVSYRVVFSGLSVPATHGATGAMSGMSGKGEMSGMRTLPDIMFHGPKLLGTKAPELIFMIDYPVSPVTGVRHVNDRQIAELKSGQWYVNIHTPKYPDGEIRGWFTPVGSPTTY